MQIRQDCHIARLCIIFYNDREKAKPLGSGFDVNVDPNCPDLRNNRCAQDRVISRLCQTLERQPRNVRRRKEHSLKHISPHIEAFKALSSVSKPNISTSKIPEDRTSVHESGSAPTTDGIRDIDQCVPGLSCARRCIESSPGHCRRPGRVEFPNARNVTGFLSWSHENMRTSLGHHVQFQRAEIATVETGGITYLRLKITHGLETFFGWATSYIFIDLNKTRHGAEQEDDGPYTKARIINGILSLDLSFASACGSYEVFRLDVMRQCSNFVAEISEATTIVLMGEFQKPRNGGHLIEIEFQDLNDGRAVLDMIDSVWAEREVSPKPTAVSDEETQTCDQASIVIHSGCKSPGRPEALAHSPRLAAHTDCVRHFTLDRWNKGTEQSSFAIKLYNIHNIFVACLTRAQAYSSKVTKSRPSMRIPKFTRIAIEVVTCTKRQVMLSGIIIPNIYDACVDKQVVLITSHRISDIDEDWRMLVSQWHPNSSL